MGKAGIERTPGALFPTDSDGHAVDEYSKGGVTGKVRISRTEARLGNLQPKLPVINFNDGRLLPQTFEGGQITSSEIDGLTLTAGQLQSTKTRSSTDDIDLRIGGATRPAGTQACFGLGNAHFAGHAALGIFIDCMAVTVRGKQRPRRAVDTGLAHATAAVCLLYTSDAADE